MKLPALIILMGVSGSGKTTVGELVSARTGGIFLDGDSFHPPANKEKMGAGIPLTDEDRWPWFDAMMAAVEEQQARPVILACSALKKRYREYLLTKNSGARFVFLQGSYELIQSRIASREHEYMPASLLQSQFEALEVPDDSERNRVVEIDIDETPEAVARDIVEQCRFDRSQ